MATRPDGLVLVLALAVALCAPACEEKPPAPRAVARTPHGTASSIPRGPVEGKIAGVAFTVRDARYHVDRRPGYEKLEVTLSGEPAASACARLPKEAPAIWLRRRGAGSATVGEVRLEPGSDSEWAVHYQVRGERGWIGSGDAAALVVVRSATGTAIEGDLSVGFADVAGSSASGTFVAQHCPVSIDRPVRGVEQDDQMPEGWSQ